MAQADHKKSVGETPETGQQANGSKLTAVEVGLLGIVALVFCFIGLLAASALFNFDLPVGNIFGERSAITSAPPYAGVFLYEDNKFFDMTQHEGLPTQFSGIPTSRSEIPLVVLYETHADRNQMKLIFETGAYIPIRGKAGPDGAVVIMPEQALQPGLYCFQQLNAAGASPDAFYWCFIVDVSNVLD